MRNRECTDRPDFKLSKTLSTPDCIRGAHFICINGGTIWGDLGNYIFGTDTLSVFRRLVVSGNGIRSNRKSVPTIDRVDCHDQLHILFLAKVRPYTII